MIPVHLWALGILLLGGAFLTLGDIVFLYWKGHVNANWYAIGFLLYMVAIVLLIRTYRYENIGIAAAILDISNVLFIVIVGWLFFNQSLTGYQIAGIGFSGIALLLFELGEPA